MRQFGPKWIENFFVFTLQFPTAKYSFQGPKPFLLFYIHHTKAFEWLLYIIIRALTLSAIVSCWDFTPDCIFQASYLRIHVLNGCYACRFQSNVVIRIFVIKRPLNFPMFPLHRFVIGNCCCFSFQLLTSAINSCFKWLISLRIPMEFSYKNFGH